MNIVIYKKSNGEIVLHKIDNSPTANLTEIFNSFILDKELSSSDYDIVEISEDEWLKANQWSDKIIDVNTRKIIIDPNIVQDTGPTLALRTIPFTDIAKLK